MSLNRYGSDSYRKSKIQFNGKNVGSFQKRSGTSPKKVRRKNR